MRRPYFCRSYTGVDPHVNCQSVFPLVGRLCDNPNGDLNGPAGLTRCARCQCGGLVGQLVQEAYQYRDLREHESTNRGQHGSEEPPNVAPVERPNRKPESCSVESVQKLELVDCSTEHPEVLADRLLGRLVVNEELVGDRLQLLVLRVLHRPMSRSEGRKEAIRGEYEIQEYPYVQRV